MFFTPFKLIFTEGDIVLSHKSGLTSFVVSLEFFYKWRLGGLASVWWEWLIKLVKLSENIIVVCMQILNKEERERSDGLSEF